MGINCILLYDMYVNYVYFYSYNSFDREMLQAINVVLHFT